MMWHKSVWVNAPHEFMLGRHEPSVRHSLDCMLDVCPRTLFVEPLLYGNGFSLLPVQGSAGVDWASRCPVASWPCGRVTRRRCKRGSSMWRRETWPKPNFVAEDRPHVLFILAPPYTGSTAIATLLNSSTRTMLLHEQGEGQWLIPGLCAEDRWNRR